MFCLWVIFGARVVCLLNNASSMLETLLSSPLPERLWQYITHNTQHTTHNTQHLRYYWSISILASRSSTSPHTSTVFVNPQKVRGFGCYFAVPALLALCVLFIVCPMPKRTTTKGMPDEGHLVCPFPGCEGGIQKQPLCVSKNDRTGLSRLRTHVSSHIMEHNDFRPPQQWLAVSTSRLCPTCDMYVCSKSRSCRTCELAVSAVVRSKRHAPVADSLPELPRPRVKQKIALGGQRPVALSSSSSFFSFCCA